MNERTAPGNRRSETLARPRSGRAVRHLPCCPADGSAAIVYDARPTCGGADNTHEKTIPLIRCTGIEPAERLHLTFTGTVPKTPLEMVDAAPGFELPDPSTGFSDLDDCGSYSVRWLRTWAAGARSLDFIIKRAPGKKHAALALTMQCQRDRDVEEVLPALLAGRVYPWYVQTREPWGLCGSAGPFIPWSASGLIASNTRHLLTRILDSAGRQLVVTLQIAAPLAAVPGASVTLRAYDYATGVAAQVIHQFADAPTPGCGLQSATRILNVALPGDACVIDLNLAARGQPFSAPLSTGSVTILSATLV